MEIEVLEEKPRKDDSKKEFAHKLKWAAESADRLVDELYGLATSESDKESDKSEFIDIIVAAKGVGKALKDILARHSDIGAETQKRIDTESDNFAKGLLGEREDEEV